MWRGKAFLFFPEVNSLSDMQFDSKDYKEIVCRTQQKDRIFQRACFKRA